MAKNLIIVESPAKARTIGKFLGKNFTVTASMGHVRDLPPSKLGFDPENKFSPDYEISKSKKKTVSDLKKQINKDTLVFLATDEDREGEAISWHLLKALSLENNSVKRIVFHEVTKQAILKALKNPREVNQQLVDAQQARRILDRAVGYKISPLLWKKIKPGLSAGRVQSVSVHIIVEREKEIRGFKPEEFWKISAEFLKFNSELKKIHNKNVKVKNKYEAEAIEASVKKGDFFVKDIDERITKKNPSAPYTTSTLQQDASIKMGFSVKRTMVVAQQLYEGNFEIPNYSGGLITYMRTDSTVLSLDALAQSQKIIKSDFGKEFCIEKPRIFKNRAINAQEAHEAIRPVDLSLKPKEVKAHLSSDQFRLYSLIWQRTISSQMSSADIARTTLKIEGGVEKEYLFISQGQRVVFPGFLIAYSKEDSNKDHNISEKDVILPRLEKKQKLETKNPKKPLKMEQLYTKPPPRYSEASLVKKLESEGIGRPSTYAPTISTIQERGYVEISSEKKLKPTSIGEVVTDFLTNHFSEIINLGFTAKIERNFDRIAQGEEDWVDMMSKFYKPFNERVVEKDESVSRAEVLKRRIFDEPDPKTGKQVSVSFGRYGPMVQIGTREDEEKPQFASLPSNVNLNEVTFEEAMKCFELPRSLGDYKSSNENDLDFNGEEIIVNKGRYGPYIKVGKKFFSLPVENHPMEVSLEEAQKIIVEGLEKIQKSIIQDFGEIKIIDGRFGPYIKSGKKNYKIPKGLEPENLDLKACENIITESLSKSKKGKYKKLEKKQTA